MSSLTWEEDQDTLVKVAVMRGKKHQRKFRLAVAANLELEAGFNRDLEATYQNKELFQIVPLEGCHMSLRSDSFRLLSRMGCLVEHYLASRHRTYPTKLFQVLGDASLGRVLAQDAACVKDKFTLRMQELFPEFSGETFLGNMAALAAKQKHDTGAVESLHASIRRHVANWLYNEKIQHDQEGAQEGDNTYTYTLSKVYCQKFINVYPVCVWDFENWCNPPQNLLPTNIGY
eukprot:6492800-Amphidinium_carterae.2